MKSSIERSVRTICLSAGLALLFAVATLQMRADPSITLRSGNGMIGSQDAQLRFLAYGAFGNITPTTADFTSVQTGAFAHIVTPYGTYVQTLPSDPLAQWVATTSALSGGSALYAIPFTVTDSVIGSASLDLGYAVDNALNGVYINGSPISNNPLDGDYHGEYYVMRSDIASLLNPNAVNWLYLNAADYGDLAAFIFSATITIQGGTPAAPTVSPNTGGNTGHVSVTVIGRGFEGSSGPGRPGPTLTLSGPGTTITATNVNVASPNILTGTFDLTSATPGVWTVSVINPDKASTVLNNSFTVVSGGGSSLSLHKIGTPAVRGRNQTYFITLTNSGNQDSGPQPFSEVLEPWFTPQSTTTTPVSYEALSLPGGQSYNAGLQWVSPNIPPGAAFTESYTVSVPSTMNPGDEVDGPSCFVELGNSACFQTLKKDLAVSAVINTACGAIGRWIPQWPVVPKGCTLAFVQNFLEFDACSLEAGILCSVASHYVLANLDPNDLVGPTGYGNQDWFQPPTSAQYSLSFNNEPTATNPATNVYVTDSFDPTPLDLSSLAVSAITIGNVSYSPSTNVPLASQAFGHDIDLRPTQDLILRVNASLNQTTNVVNISFLSLDPATGLEPTDPTVGFLSPGASGAVLFTVNPKPSLKTGTTIQSSGSVIFDSNAAINTNTWLNTVDIDAPTSKVIALPATEPATFMVSWSGTDVGSGIAAYSIYVSDNGAAFTPWQSSVALTSAFYSGVAGHTYGFYSIATDGAGNVEAAKTAADTSTDTALAPQVTGISPTYGAPAALIIITGTNFGATQGNGSVTVGDAPSYVVSWLNTAIAILIPSNASTGNIVVTAGGEASNGASFTFYPYPAITGISPTSGPAGTPVTITGTGLLDGEGNGTVTFNGTAATILSKTSTSIRVNVPAGATSGPVSVHVNSDTVKSSTSFTVTHPQISSISPNYGAPAALIRITGTNFGANKSNGYVTVGGALSYVLSWSNTLIAIQVPSHATTGNIVVTTEGEASNGVHFTYYPYPAITGISPASGPVGTSVTITGTNLLDGEGSATVTFNGTPATILSKTSTSIQVDVPVGATSGPVSVHVNSDTVKSSTFTVNPPPQISGISPNYGAPAALIAITGTNFGATQGNSKVTVGGAPSYVVSWSNTAIAVEVSSRGVTGNIVVTTEGEASNGAPFTFYSEPSIISLSAASGPVGTAVTITGDNLQDGGNNAIVTFNGTPAIISNDTSGSIQVTVPTGATSGRVLVNGVTVVASTSFDVTPPAS